MNSGEEVQGVELADVSLGDVVIEIAEELAEARVTFARAFMMNKISKDGLPVTDKTAEHRAIEATGDLITVLEARLAVAMHEMRNQR